MLKGGGLVAEDVTCIAGHGGQDMSEQHHKRRQEKRRCSASGGEVKLKGVYSVHSAMSSQPPP